MEVAIIAVIIIVIVVVQTIAKSSGGGTPTYANIVKRGVPARGILLQVNATPSGTVGIAPMRYQMRFMTMDIEIPGQAPYQAQVTPFIPTNLAASILPGASVELRINPKQPTQIAIIGPGAGFNAALLNSGGMQQ